MREVERVSVGINGQHCIVDIQVQTIKQVVVVLAKEGGRSVLFSFMEGEWIILAVVNERGEELIK